MLSVLLEKVEDQLAYCSGQDVASVRLDVSLKAHRLREERRNSVAEYTTAVSLANHHIVRAAVERFN